MTAKLCSIVQYTYIHRYEEYIHNYFLNKEETILFNKIKPEHIKVSHSISNGYDGELYDAKLLSYKYISNDTYNDCKYLGNNPYLLFMINHDLSR